MNMQLDHILSDMDEGRRQEIITEAFRTVNQYDALVSAAFGIVPSSRIIPSEGPVPTLPTSADAPASVLLADKTIEPLHRESINPEDVEYRTWPGSDNKFAMPVGDVGDIMPEGHPQAGLVYAGMSPGPDAGMVNRPLYVEAEDRPDTSPADADALVSAAQADHPGLRLPTAEEIRFISGQPLSPEFGLKAGPNDAYLDDDPLLAPHAGETVFTKTGIARQRPASVPAQIRLVMT